ncbi:protein of unknown function [Candidatus Promineifilum breve]|uniref:Uncharacterized protein n=1 Tax=Candidatus Promineifilum breve TaxID=1806508 RepID=A0A160T1Z4_9CHLR|nr:protein of unknown function [Candidatus Promineifilum breve]
MLIQINFLYDTEYNEKEDLIKDSPVEPLCEAYLSPVHCIAT